LRIAQNNTFKAQPQPGKAGFAQIDPSDQRGTTRVDGRFERMGPDDGSSGECFAAQRGDRFNLEGSRWDLSQMKDATEKAVFLIIAFSRAGRLELQLCVAGSWRPSQAVFRPMMMQHTGKDVDHEVSGQCGDGNQGTAQESFHFTTGQQLKLFSSSHVLQRADGFLPGVASSITCLGPQHRNTKYNVLRCTNIFAEGKLLFGEFR
jgi:hypothetical protein